VHDRSAASGVSEPQVQQHAVRHVKGSPVLGGQAPPACDARCTTGVMAGKERPTLLLYFDRVEAAQGIGQRTRLRSSECPGGRAATVLCSARMPWSSCGVCSRAAASAARWSAKFSEYRNAHGKPAQQLAALRATHVHQ
jgi:hypothetical protein